MSVAAVLVLIGAGTLADVAITVAALASLVSYPALLALGGAAGAAGGWIGPALVRGLPGQALRVAIGTGGVILAARLGLAALPVTCARVTRSRSGRTG